MEQQPTDPMFGGESPGAGDAIEHGLTVPAPAARPLPVPIELQRPAATDQPPDVFIRARLLQFQREYEALYRPNNEETFFGLLQTAIFERPNRSQRLPNHLVSLVATFLYDDLQSIGRMAQVCRAWHMELSQSVFWKELVRVRWGTRDEVQHTRRLFSLIGQGEFRPSLQLVVPLVRAGANLGGCFGNRKLTPLLMACFHGHLAVIQWMLNNGSSMSEQSACGKPPAMCAAWGGQQETLAWLLQHKPRWRDTDSCGNTLLLCAAMSGSVPTCCWLLNQGASVKETNIDGQTPLLMAASGGHVTLLRWLLGHGASINETTRLIESPLICAALGARRALSSVETVQFLLSQGCRLDQRSQFGRTILMQAAAAGNPAVVQFVLSHVGSEEIHQTDQFGQTALHLSRMNDHHAVTQLLLDRGADISAVDNYGGTPVDLYEVLISIKTKQKERLDQILPRLLGVILQTNPLQSTLTDEDARFLFSCLRDNLTVREVVFLHTGVTAAGCAAELHNLLRDNHVLTRVYLGHRPDQVVPVEIQHILERNADLH